MSRPHAPAPRTARTLTLVSALAILAAACADVPSAPSVAAPARAAESTGELFDLPAGITEADVRSHVIAPRHLVGARMEHEDAARGRLDRAAALDRAASPGATSAHLTATVDLAKLVTNLHAALKDSVAGYMLQIRRNGVLAYTSQWNWAQTPTNLGTGWTENTRMHVASVSKFLTAVALVKALDAKGISYDAKIVDYLPSYWYKGINTNLITFRQLLRHESGFRYNESESDFGTMKSNVAAGVLKTDIGKRYYQNVNFALMRILIPIINGTVSKSAGYSSSPVTNDVVWDLVTVTQFRTYMQDKVFTPAGVSSVGFAPTYDGKNALAYKTTFAKNQEAGWDSGDLSSVAGGVGFRLSTKELLSVMHHVRRMNTILPAAKTQYMLTNEFGIEAGYTEAGMVYEKTGAWSNDDRMEQSIADFLPDGVELALFVNSSIGAPGQEPSLGRVVSRAMYHALKY